MGTPDEYRNGEIVGNKIDMAKLELAPFVRFGETGFIATAKNILYPGLQDEMLQRGIRNFEVGDVNKTGMRFIGDPLSIKAILAQGNPEEDTTDNLEPGNPNNYTYVSSLAREATHRPYGPGLLGATDQEWKEIYPVIRPALEPKQVGRYIPDILDAIDLLDKDIQRSNRSETGISEFNAAEVFKPFAFRGIFSALFNSRTKDGDIVKLPRLMRNAAFWPTVLGFAGGLDKLNRFYIWPQYQARRAILQRAVGRIVGFKKTKGALVQLEGKRGNQMGEARGASGMLLRNLEQATSESGIPLKVKSVSPRERVDMIPAVHNFLKNSQEDSGNNLDEHMTAALNILINSGNPEDQELLNTLRAELETGVNLDEYVKDRNSSYSKLIGRAYSKTIRIKYPTAVGTVLHLGAAGFDTTSDVGPDIFRMIMKYQESTDPDQQKAFQELAKEVDEMKSILKNDTLSDQEKYHKYTQYVLSKNTMLEAFKKETLRLRPILPNLPMVANKTFEIPYEDENGNIVKQLINKGDPIMIALGIVHKDPMYWPDPEKFNPLRHIEYDNKGNIISTDAGNKGRPYGVNAFAEMFKERRCPGKEFADAELNILHLHFLMNYDLVGFEDDGISMLRGTAAMPNLRIQTRLKEKNIIKPPVPIAA